VVAGLLAGMGWLDVLRGLGWLAVGPSVGDALPLLQLATFDVQPLLRVLFAWVLAGALAGIGLAPIRPWRRGVLALVLGLALLLLASQAAYALARNLPLATLLWHRRPGAGPIVEACAFALGAVIAEALVRPLGDGQGLGPRWALPARLRWRHDDGLRRG
jgi:hypothetical protein